MTPAAKPREHTTHFDDCGCQSTALRATNAKLNRRVQEMESAIARITKIERRIAERAQGKPLGRIEAGFALAAAEVDADRWCEVAEVLAEGCRACTHEANDYNCQDWPPGNGCSGCDGDEKRKAALARFDALVDEDADKWCTCNDEHTCEGHRA